MEAGEERYDLHWNDHASIAHELTFEKDCRLSSLEFDWEREMAALWRLEADVNNGAYLQFLGNWGRESYVYASQALKKIGARRMAELIDACQLLVDEHLSFSDQDEHDYQELIEELPEFVFNRTEELSQEFMKYPEDLPRLALDYYEKHFEQLRAKASESD